MDAETFVDLVRTTVMHGSVKGVVVVPMRSLANLALNLPALRAAG